MGTLGTLATAYIGIILIAALLSTFFMWLGAKVSNVKKATFWRSLLAAIGSAIISGLISWLFAGFTGIGAVIGFLIGLGLALLVIKAAYETDYGKALLVWLFHLVAEVIAIIIAIFTFAGALLNLFR